MVLAQSMRLPDLMQSMVRPSPRPRYPQIPVWTRGNPELAGPQHKKLAICGPRRAGENTLMVARQAAAEAVDLGYIIVNGLAAGVDATTLHMALRKVGGQCIAVLGTPIDNVFPPENAILQDRIANLHLLVSQFPPTHNTIAADFLARNETIMWIADALLLIGVADKRSGSWSTASAAKRLGKPIYTLLCSVKPDGSRELPPAGWPSLLAEVLGCSGR